MGNRRTVEPIRQEEKDIASYKDYLNRLAQQNPASQDIFTNKGEAHASILMATLMANTERRLDMYCTGLRPGILCGVDEGDAEGFKGSYWDEFKRFFQETLLSDNFVNNSVRLLVQTDRFINNAPFRIVGNALRNPQTQSKIQVRLISEESKKRIEDFFGNQDCPNVNYNFAIFDGKAFRLEYEPDSYRALGSFNNPSWGRLLSDMFNEAFNSAINIADRVRSNSPF